MKAFKNKCLYLLVLLLVISCAKDEEDLTGSIYGKVTDTQSGEVLHGATVTLTPGGISRTTGDDGTYEFLNLNRDNTRLKQERRIMSLIPKVSVSLPAKMRWGILR